MVDRGTVYWYLIVAFILVVFVAGISFVMEEVTMWWSHNTPEGMEQQRLARDVARFQQNMSAEERDW